ncbi:thiamine pyrophosphate-binding protein [Actinomycetospora sp. OC33-EN08]|uniref:Thiamine pyrophosphate-binding protein n=1 Tax=Actinomycetospora aurantiaca TaxID=3129233 RepID=A0ABU8MG88_9PSEU
MAPITGAESLVRTLVRLGVQDAFNIVGLGLFPLAEAFYAHRDEVRYVSALNETNLGLMAAGYARANRSAAFVNVYHASGTGLGMMALTTAWADGVPMVFTTTTSSRALAGRDQYAAVPRAVTEMSGQYTKWSAEIPSADRIPELVERAFQIANTPPYGPVHLAFPMDVWLEQTEDTEDTEHRQPTEVLADFAAAPAAVGRVAGLLRTSERPVIVTGAEVARYGAVDATVALAEQLGATVLHEDKVADLGFPTTHPQFAGRLGAHRAVVGQADVVLLLGVELTESGLTRPVEFGSATTVVLSPDPLLLTRQLRPDLAVLGAPRPTLEAVAAAVGTLPDEVRGARAAAARELHDARDARNERIRAIRFDAEELAIGRILTELEAAMPTGTIVVNHCASGEPFVEDLLPHPDTDAFFGISSKASAQGWGGPASIGIQLARPDRRVVALLGDGGFMFSSSAIYAAAQQDLPVVFVILNNGGWRDIGALATVARSPLVDAEDVMGWTFGDPPIDHAAYAASLGLDSRRVATPGELRAALDKAFADRCATLIEVMNSPEDAHEFSRVFTQADG